MKLKENVLIKAAKLLSSRDQKKIFGVIAIQIIFSLLDLVGVALIGVLGALAITGVQAKTPGDRVSFVLDFLGLSDQPLQVQATVIGLLAAFFLVSKTIFSVYFVRKTVYFLARKNAEISAELLSKVLSQSLTRLRTRSMQELLFGVTSGVSALVTGILSTSILVISDVLLLLILGGGLFAVDPSIALSTILVFAIVSFVLYRLLQVRAKNLGIEFASTSINYSESLLEVLNSYREILVRNRRGYYSEKIGGYGKVLAKVRAEQAFMPNISKYVVEVTIVLGCLAIGVVQFSRNDAAHAVAVLTVFLAASTRIAPALLRLQQGALSIKSHYGTAMPTLELIDSLKEMRPTTEQISPLDFEHSGFTGSVRLSNVFLKYQGAKDFAVKNISLTVNTGEVLALVGPSGSGKTSSVDIILGIIEASEGFSEVSGVAPLEAIKKWPGAIGYVPQDVMIANTTVRENVLLGFDPTSDFDEQVWRALKIAQLDKFVESLPEGLDTKVGDRGARLSGGQRQRLGIARAMFTNPKLLVLDEATSALDGSTEASISESIQAMRGDVTIVMIAHRLSTVRAADKVVYLDKGLILASGKFDEVRNLVPDFDRQAQLMGL